MIDFFIFLVVFFIAVQIGIFFQRYLKISFLDSYEEFALSAALGLGVLAFIIIILGSLNLFYKEVLIFVFGLLFVLLFKGAFNFFGKLFTGFLNDLRQAELFYKIILGFIGVAFIASLFGALAPPIGIDELCYHLTQPKNYVAAHKLYELPYSTNSLWPYLGEMLFTIGLLLHNAETAKLFHWGAYVLVCIFIFVVTRRNYGKKEGVLAAAFYALMPAAFAQAGFGYIDHFLALYFLSAFYAFSLFLESRKLGWVLLAGVYCGFCLSTKLIGLYSLGALAIIGLGCIVFFKNRHNLVRGAFCFAVATIIFGSYFYLRSWMLRGNPVFPFYPHLFGGHGWLDHTYIDSHARGTGFLDYLMVLWDLTVHPQWFGGERIGPVFILFFPLCFLFLKKNHFFVLGISYLLLLSVFWFLVDPNIRFFYGGMALMSIFAGGAVGCVFRSSSKMFRFALGGILLLVLALEALFAIYRFRQEAALLFNGNKEQYLQAHDRSYAVAKEINQMLSPKDKILSFGEIRGFYFNNLFVLEGDFANITKYREKKWQKDDLRGYLRGHGFTHTLVLSGLTLPESLSGLEEIAVFNSSGARYTLYRL